MSFNIPIGHNILCLDYIYIYTVKPLYKKLFFYSTFFLIERFSYKEVFTFPMILRIHLGPIIENALYIVHRVIYNLYVIYIYIYIYSIFIYFYLFSINQKNSLEI